jgi:predicted peptidase
MARIELRQVCTILAGLPAVALATWISACTADPPRPRAPYTARPVLGDWLLSVTAQETAWGFLLHVPEGYGASAERYPLLVYLEGCCGNLGWDPNAELVHAGPLAPLYRSARTFDPSGRARLDPRVRRSFVLVPRLPYFDPNSEHPLGHWSPDTLLGLVEWVATSYRVDRDRIYVTGLSEGGGGAWAFASRHADLVAAVVPVSCALRSRVTDGMRAVPIWMFHAFDDDHESNSDAAFREVTGRKDFFRGYPHAGGDPEEPAALDQTISFSPPGELGAWTAGVGPPRGRVAYTLYASGGHRVGDRTYENPDLWRWMFAQSRAERARPAAAHGRVEDAR